MKGSLIFALALMGFTGVITEALLIREFMVSFYGNELSIGVILANWLILEALGSLLSSRLVEKARRPHLTFALLQLVISLFLPLAIYSARIVKSVLNLPPGQAVGFPTVLYSSFLVLLPLALADGAQFTFGARAYSRASSQAPAAARAYIYEALGAAAGGLLFTYLFIPRLQSLQIGLSIAALNILAAVLLLMYFREKQPARPLRQLLIYLPALLPLGLALSLLLSLLAAHLHESSLRRQWRGLSLRHYQNSVYGNVAVVERGGEYTVFADGLPMFTTPTPNIESVEEFIHLPMLFHSSPRKVLLIGGGVGGALRELLKHPVEAIDYAELEPLIIEVAQKFPTALTKEELGNPRVTINYVDGRLFVNRSRGPYDVVLVNLPPPSTLELNRFYSLEFFGRVGEILDEEGILALRAPGSLSYMSEEMANLNRCLERTLRQAFPEVRLIPGEEALLLASPSPGLSAVGPALLAERLEERKLETKLMGEFYLKYKLDERRARWLAEALHRVRRVTINRDLVPSGVFYHTSLWASLFSPGLRGSFRLMGRVNMWTFLLPVGLFVLVVMILGRRGRAVGRAPVVFAILTTGMAGMVFDTALILAFQCLYGYVYHVVGLLIAAFMLGLAGGGTITSRLLGQGERSRSLLAGLEILVLGYAVLVPGMLILFQSQSGRPGMLLPTQLALFLLNWACGMLVGAEFPLANQVYVVSRERASQTAGLIYASDLVGAWVGVLLASVWLIPVLGIPQTCLVVAGAKLASLVLLLASRP